MVSKLIFVDMTETRVKQKKTVPPQYHVIKNLNG